MQGMLAKARQVRAVVAQARNSSGIDDPESSDPGGHTGGYASVGHTDAALLAALKAVTHGATATVPREALREVERLADVSEESLTMVLKHIEENVHAKASEWRKIHGALKLCEHLLKGSEDDAPLIGKMWFEVKLWPQLEVLADFQYNEDSRVASLISRTASSVQRAAEQTILRDRDSPLGGAAKEPSSRDASAERGPAERLSAEPRRPSKELPSSSSSLAGGREERPPPSRSSARGEEESGERRPAGTGRAPSVASSSSLEGRVIGRPAATSSSDRRDRDQRSGGGGYVSDEGPDDIEAALAKAAEMAERRRRAAEEASTSDLERGGGGPGQSTPSSCTSQSGGAPQYPPRRCCGCLRRMRGSSGPTVGARPSEVASLIK